MRIWIGSRSRLRLICRRNVCRTSWSGGGIGRGSVLKFGIQIRSRGITEISGAHGKAGGCQNLGDVGILELKNGCAGHLAKISARLGEAENTLEVLHVLAAVTETEIAGELEV